MRQLLPCALDEVDPYDAYRPAAGGDWCRLNMVVSVDGAVTDERGRTGGLGGAGDHEVFHVLRAHADVILAGAGTVRAEAYGPHRVRAALAERRRADGRDAPAPIVVVSRSLDLDLTAPLFAEAITPTVVLTCGTAPPDRRAAVERVARVLVAGDAAVDLSAGLAALRRETGAAQVLCEGGPRLNTGLLTAGLVDELCVTVAPTLLDGAGPRMAERLDGRLDLELLAAFEEAGDLLLRYRIRR